MSRHPNSADIRASMPDHTCEAIDQVHDFLLEHDRDDLLEVCRCLRRDNVALRTAANNAIRQLSRWERGELTRD